MTLKPKQLILLPAACLVSAALAWAVTRHLGTDTAASLPASSTPAPAPARPARSGMESPATPARAPTQAARVPVDIETVREEIQEAAVQYSDTELPKFERWLKSSDPAIRAAATDGLLQSGLSAGAILLRDAATASKDPQEIQTLSEGAAILEAPPATAALVESLKNQPDRKPARHFNTGGTAPAPAGQ